MGEVEIRYVRLQTWQLALMMRPIITPRADSVPSQKLPLTVANIKTRVAQVYGVTIEELLTKPGERGISEPGQVAIYLVRKLTNLSFFRIAGQFNRTQGEPIQAAVDSVEKRRKLEPEFDQLLTRLEESFEKIEKPPQLVLPSRPQPEPLAALAPEAALDAVPPLEVPEADRLRRAQEILTRLQGLGVSAQRIASSTRLSLYVLGAIREGKIEMTPEAYRRLRNTLLRALGKMSG